MATPAADLCMLRSASSMGDLNLVSQAWLGSVCKSSRRFMLGFKDLPDPEVKRWYIGLHHWPKSSVLMWPVTTIMIGNETYFQFSLDIAEPCLLPLFELDTAAVVAVAFEWRSWL